ncbi:transglycosylase [Sphaerisporangium krabiense]|uniref:Putative membrane protein YeaQ/YmgE (Transglycosylase-associated protein family) n=1 Tax=Sphaerisporangium krabiense TaxID=763782 RepID=A0A7W8Z968_9ACTN|nr:GlsB/YeaQ/YmgE family stress response membrane protein [Sphaerisporangium krabiense]MBB5629651.1 putative membrane protein YeaQ/YmgE (transglycosylase-associated protein family) [Sphaerisporangium krabiense]GII63749.1 transglycosylase [Sphaerisporangium krabiense]
MQITGIFSAIIVGLVIGVIARLVVPGRQNIPIWLTIVIGIVAALIGTAIADALGAGATRGIHWLELVLQIVLAVIGVIIAASLYGKNRSKVT